MTGMDKPVYPAVLLTDLPLYANKAMMFCPLYKHFTTAFSRESGGDVVYQCQQGQFPLQASRTLTR